MFNCFGHQSLFDVPLPAVVVAVLPVTGHLLSLLISALPSIQVWICEAAGHEFAVPVLPGGS
jgi:hypothetical protein